MGGLSWFFAVVFMLSAQGAGSNQADPRFSASELDVVSVSPTSFAVTWYTGDPTRPQDLASRPAAVPATTVLRFGTTPDPSTWHAVTVPGLTAYHRVEVAGLAPGTSYYFEASSNGVRAVNVLAGMEVRSPAWLRTPPLPPGRRLATVAVGNDWHLWEQRSGIVVGDWPPALPVDWGRPYWRAMSAAVVEDARAHGADVLVANGDVTNEAEPGAVTEAAGLFAGFGGPTMVLRGNHDRAHQGTQYASCSPVPARPSYRDCFADAFGYLPGASANRVLDVGTLRLVGLDSSDVFDGHGHLTESTLDFARHALAEAGERPVLLFLHHPSAWASIWGWPIRQGFMLDEVSLGALDRLVRDSGNVLAVFGGHTHRNLRSFSGTPDVLYQEVGAVKEHIGGYGLLEVYEGGLVYSFRQAACDACLEWSARSRQQYFGFFPFVAQGTLADRAYTTVSPRPVGPSGGLGPRTGPLVVSAATAGS